MMSMYMQRHVYLGLHTWPHMFFQGHEHRQESAHERFRDRFYLGPALTPTP